MSSFVTTPGFVVAAPTSGSGKTVLTLAIARALSDRRVAVSPRKAGPDYIDPTFLALAARTPALNLDPWSMSRDQLRARTREDESTLVVESAMGLFDGAADGSGSAADLAATLGFPVVLVLDAARTSQSLAAVLRGFATHRADVRVVGVIVNRAASERHARMIERAVAPVCEELGIARLGTVPRDGRLTLPSRHLGLVPAGERDDVEAFVAHAARLVSEHVDLDALVGLAAMRSGTVGEADPAPAFPVLGQRIAVAHDAAFAFLYPHALADWRAAGAEVTTFSPLADEAPAEGADAVFLPGGYPELHAGTLAAAGTFRAGMRRAAERGTFVYGECGGYMTLGEGLMDADGKRHAMLGLLPLETSFAERRLHLGYREMRGVEGTPLAGVLRGHEHHHASIVREGDAERAFAVRDAEGGELAPAGLRVGSVMGSFLHVVAKR